MLLSTNRRMLRLLGVGILEQVSGCARIPEVSAEEEALGFVELEYREPRGIRVSLRGPLAGPEVKRPRKRDHRQVDGGDRSAEAGVRHVAGRASRILEDGHLLVEVHQLAERLNHVIAAALQCWRLPCQIRRR